MQDNNIMKYESVLPEGFDGVFRFTNWSKEDFIGTWNSREYMFPAETTSPMVIPEHSPLEIQHIRKKFAKDLAEREFFKGKKYKTFLKQERGSNGEALRNSFHQAASYNMNDLTELIQKCLEPLPISEAIVRQANKRDVEGTLTRNDDGALNTQVVDTKTSLRQRALNS